MEALIAVTYRCNARCSMCNIWMNPSDESLEITPYDIMKLPENLKFANITGGEPFLRDDISEIIKAVSLRSKRVVISTNGYMTDKIISVLKENRNVGVRVSLEGLPAANDELRGLKDGFDHGLRTILKLHELGIKDIGFGITVSDRNIKDLLELYSLANWLKVEFATSAVHNSFYFHKFDNILNNKSLISDEFLKLSHLQLKSRRPKDWFRAYFNTGLAKYVLGGERLLPCGMGTDVFFVDPFGEIMPCNVLNISMGNIRHNSFKDIWYSENARIVREMVSSCSMNCWMTGSAAPAIKKHLLKPVIWIIMKKLSKTP